MTAGGDHLLECCDELAVIDASLRAAQAGCGARTLVEGPPGIGKTELLAAAVARARSQDMLVLSAHAGELERSFPYAVVRQLFEVTPSAKSAEAISTRRQQISSRSSRLPRMPRDWASPSSPR